MEGGLLIASHLTSPFFPEVNPLNFRENEKPENDIVPRLDYAAVPTCQPADGPRAISTLVLFYCRTRGRKEGDEVVEREWVSR